MIWKPSMLSDFLQMMLSQQFFALNSSVKANQISATAASTGNCVKHENIQIDPMVGRNKGHFLRCCYCYSFECQQAVCVFYMLNQYSCSLQFECRTSCFYGNKHTRNILYLLLGARVKKICNILRKRQDSVKSTFEFKNLEKIKRRKIICPHWDSNPGPLALYLEL